MDNISVKGWKNGVLVVVPAAAAWDEVVTQIEDKLKEAQDFWKGAQTTLDVGERKVPHDDMEGLLGLMRGDYGLVPTAVVTTAAETRSVAGKLGLEAHEKLPSAEKKATPVAGEAAAPALPLNNALYLKQTIRSGQRVQHDGHLVICGDVNAGAEVVASGDIVVFGTLRGVAHAGSAGDETARIVATNLRPTQLRIGSRIARSPDAGSPPLSKFPEIALVENGEICINPL
ncbi:MAG TPA: septum site-determining protein MinC [Pantanalinema sp.]